MNPTLWLNSVGVAAGAWAVASLGGLLIAMTWMSRGEKWRRAGTVAAVVTLALPPFLPASCWLEVTAAWRVAMGAEQSEFLMLPVTALVLGLGLWPLTFFFVLGAWQRIQSSHLEAEPQLRGTALWHWLLWPAARTYLKLSSLLTLTLALSNFTVPTLFQVRVFTEEFWIRYNTQFDLGGALLATWPIWILPIVLIVFFPPREFSWPRESIGLAPGLFAARLGPGWVWTAGLASAAVLLGSLALPLLQLVKNPRTWTELPGAIAAGELAITNSLLSSSVAAIATVTLGFRLATSRYGASKLTASDRVEWAARTLWLTFLLPGVILSVGLILLLNRPGLTWFYSSFGMVWLALGLRYFAPAWSGVTAAVRAQDRSLREWARLAGAPARRRFWLITWPQSGRGLGAVAYAIYLLSLWDVETLVLLQPPGGETLAIRIFNLLHYGHAAQVNALCLVTLGVALLPVLLAWLGDTTVSQLRLRRARSKGAGNGLWAVPWVMAAGFTLGGCSDSNNPAGLTYPLRSQFFSGVQVIGSRGVAPGQFNKPRSLACDRADNLYVADITGRIQKFSPEGQFLRQWQMPQTSLGKAKGMSLDLAGNVIIVEPHYQRVNHFTSDGVLVAQWGRRGTNQGEFILPRCIAVNSFGEYYLGEYTTFERVQKCSLPGDLSHTPPPGEPVPRAFTFLGSWGQPGQANGDFNRAEGIAIGLHDTVVVADSCNHRIQVFDRDGHFLRTYGSAGSAPGQFSFPYDVRIDAAGRQFICEFGNSRLSIFDGGDHLLETLGRAGREPGEFANPWAICLDSKGNLYVADSQNHRVQKLLRRAATLSQHIDSGAGNSGTREKPL